jgi:hypothetical protein
LGKRLLLLSFDEGLLDFVLKESGLYCVDDLNESKFKRVRAHIEQKLAIDDFLFGCVGQENHQLRITNRCLLQRGGVELLVSGHVDRSEFSVGQQAFPSAEGVAQELHRALVIWRQMQLAFDGKNNVEVFLRLHEVPKVGGHDLLDLRVVVRVRAEDGLGAADDVVREVVVLGVPDEVGLRLGQITRACHAHIGLS